MFARSQPRSTPSSCRNGSTWSRGPRSKEESDMTELDPRIPLADDGSAPMAPAMARALDTFAAAAMRARTVDPVTTELVRLRCAWYHDCRVCGSLRLEEARAEGVDEE